MATLEKDILLIGSKGTARHRALFDSGASYSIIRRDVAESLEVLTPLPNPEAYVFETARAGDTIQATHAVRLDFRFADSEALFSDEFILFDDCAETVIIGAQTMQVWRIKLDFEHDTIDYPRTARRLRV